MEIQTDITQILAELDAQRVERGMSYQALEDASGISKSTICRILNGQSEPTVQQLQMIAAAVQYKPAAKEIIPASFTQEAYIAYLQETIQRQSEENDRRVRQLQAHYNMLRRQDRRTIMTLGAILGILVLFICALFVYDFANLDRGWIQQMHEQGFLESVKEMFLSAWKRLEAAIWSA